MKYSIRHIVKAIRAAETYDNDIPVSNLMHDIAEKARTSYTINEYELLVMLKKHNITKPQLNIIYREYVKATRTYSVYEVASALRKITPMFRDEGVADYVDKILRNINFDDEAYYEEKIDEKYADIFDMMFNILLLGDAI